jgi:AbrB family looped-hinge helix DNA binding protein
MNYTSTVTSKGTITLPSDIRARLGIEQGNEVSIELRGDTILVKPKGGWESLLAVGAEMRADLEARGVRLPSDPTDLTSKAEAMKVEEYSAKYLPKGSHSA